VTAVRVVYSYPHRIGAGRTCYTAWQQVRGLVEAGADVTVFPGSVHRSLPAGARATPTLSRGRVRVPARAIGHQRAYTLHDRLVAHRLERMAGEVDVVHVWPRAGLRTLRTARRLGIPAVLERPNAHTGFAFEAVRAECERIGVDLPPGGEHAYDASVLALEEAEFEAAAGLLCPSEFVSRTFRERGTPEGKLVRHIYGYDEGVCHPSADRPPEGSGLRALFVGYAAVRKGLHLALDAWLASPASRSGTFLVAGEVLPAYAAYLGDRLRHPSVRMLGHRDDVPELMRHSDVLMLPSLEEGFGLVCTEAMGSGCVPLVSDACTDVCRHMDNALVHAAGDALALREQLAALDADRALLERLRAGALRTAPAVTWTAAGVRLLDAYRQVIEAHHAAGRSGGLRAA
jgi:glycosyltransferase involved in cell wall biosynthesis